jgi:hypothetical protein
MPVTLANFRTSYFRALPVVPRRHASGLISALLPHLAANTGVTRPGCACGAQQTLFELHPRDRSTAS